jgi:hypothetical protein
MDWNFTSDRDKGTPDLISHTDPAAKEAAGYG